MVTNVTSLTGNGLRDWIIQRGTALYFGGYTGFLLIFWALNPHVQYETWQALFHHTAFKVATIMALVAFVLHAWIGVWTVTTDYLKCTSLRLAVQGGVVLALSTQFFWGLMIVWGQ